MPFQKKDDKSEPTDPDGTNAVITSKDVQEQSPVLSVDDKLAIEAERAAEDKARLDLAPKPEAVVLPKGPDGHVVKPQGAEHIRVLHIYRGRRTGERTIEAGVYVATDPRLQGLADYLCDNGHAIWIVTT